MFRAKRKIMIRVLIALLGFVWMLSGCTKEYSVEGKEETGFFVRFSVDGQLRTYRENVLAERTRNGSQERIIVQGLADLSTTPQGVALILADTPAVTAKAYPENPGLDVPALVFRDSVGTEFTNLFMLVPSGMEIVVSEVNATTIRGTFKGQLADVDGKMVNISDGAFFTPFQ